MKNYLQFKNWYKDTQKAIKEKYKSDSVLMSALIASTSPRFSIKRNMNTAKYIYNDFRKQKNFVANAKKNKKRFMKKYKIGSYAI